MTQVGKQVHLSISVVKVEPLVCLWVPALRVGYRCCAVVTGSEDFFGFDINNAGGSSRIVAGWRVGHDLDLFQLIRTHAAQQVGQVGTA